MSATAGHATLITGAGGGVTFFQNADGGQASFINTDASAIVDFSLTSGRAGNGQVSAGSIAGSGTFFLGSETLVVGGNGSSTTVTGTIRDGGFISGGGLSGGTGGTLDKAGGGTLALDGIVSGVNLIAGGGDLVVSGTISGASRATISGGSLEFAGASAENVKFAGGASGTLIIDTVSGFTGAIGGFGVTDIIDLAAAPFQSGGTAFVSGGFLTVSEGGSNYQLAIDPAQQFINASFTLAPDSGAGTDITMTVVPLTSSASVSSGQYSNDVTVSSGGTLGVQSGGTAVDTSIGSGGVVVIGSGATAPPDPTIIFSGGTEIIDSGGFDGGAQISGGTQLVFGTATSATIFGGTQVVESGGTAADTTVSGGVLSVQSGATLQVDSGFTLSGYVVSTGVTLAVDSTSVTSTSLLGGGIEIVGAAGTDLGATLLGGTQFLDGLAVSAILSAGTQLVESGGTAFDTINSGGVLDLLSGGTYEIGSGFSISGFAISAGATLQVDFKRRGIRHDPLLRRHARHSVRRACRSDDHRERRERDHRRRWHRPWRAAFRRHAIRLRPRQRHDHQRRHAGRGKRRRRQQYPHCGRCAGPAQWRHIRLGFRIHDLRICRQRRRHACRRPYQRDQHDGAKRRHA